MSKEYTISTSTTSPITIDIDTSYTNDTGSEYTFNTDNITVSSSHNSTITIDDTHWADNISWDQTEFKDTMPSVQKIEDMCEEYPALNRAYETFKTIYKMTLQDYKGKQND